VKEIVMAALLCGAVWAQKPDPSVVFEVASVKASPPMAVPGASGMRMAIRMGCSGGPGSPSPGQYTCTNAPVEILIREAFGLKPYQFNVETNISAPRYDIAAKVPQGATKEQMRTMLQNLLIERFKLAWHFEKKEMQVYDLVVGKNGPKLKESPPEEPKPAADAAPPRDGPPQQIKPTMGPDGFPVFPGQQRRNSSSMSMMANGGMKMSTNDSTMEQLANTLSSQIGRPVTDATGLKGKFDYTLTFTRENLAGPMGMMVGAGDAGAPPPPPSDAPTIFAAVQDQLGLKLEQKKGSVDMFVVDHVEKTPIEN